MADITIAIPDDKLATFIDSVGLTKEGQDDAARIVIITTWLKDTARNHLWNFERSAAADSISDPMP
jgi:hypothetical protein|tara:strand:+ start:2843 stop:3040 length:198 start_codon:yes stop_codon:yes gene_type:complete